RAPHQPGLAVPGPAATVLAPLGHHRSADAPRGTVVALAIGVAPARAPLPPLLAPGRARPAPPVGHGEIPAIEPLRVLSAVDDPSGSDEPTVQGSLTRSPLPGVAEGSREQPHSGVVHPEPALVQRAAEGAAAAAAAAARRPSLGQSRRLGIGAPFSREPAHSPVDAHGVPTEASGISPVERLDPPPAPPQRQLPPVQRAEIPPPKRAPTTHRLPAVPARAALPEPPAPLPPPAARAEAPPSPPVPTEPESPTLRPVAAEPEPVGELLPASRKAEATGDPGRDITSDTGMGSTAPEAAAAALIEVLRPALTAGGGATATGPVTSVQRVTAAAAVPTSPPPTARPRHIP